MKCSIHAYLEANSKLQRFALKPKPRETLKALLRNAFKVSLVVRLTGNCCNLLLAC